MGITLDTEVTFPSQTAADTYTTSFSGQAISVTTTSLTYESASVTEFETAYHYPPPSPPSPIACGTGCGPDSAGVLVRPSISMLFAGFMLWNMLFVTIAFTFMG